MELYIKIGGISDPLHKQLKSQGIKVSASDISHLQRAVDGFIRLKVMGCMGEKEAARIAERLVGKIIRFAESVSSPHPIGNRGERRITTKNNQPCNYITSYHKATSPF